MRELSNDLNEVTFFDKISGESMTHFFSTPTTQDRIKYANGFVTRHGNKIVSTLGELRIKAGTLIYRGFKRGAFGIPAKGPISLAGLSKATVCVVSWIGHELLCGDKTIIEDIVQAEWSALNGKYTITRISDDSFSIPINTSRFKMAYDAAIDPGTIKSKFVISSKPGDSHYEPAWKTFVLQFAPDVIEAVAMHAFESALLHIASPNAEALEILPPPGDDWGEEPAAPVAPAAPEAKPDGEKQDAGSEENASPLS